MVLAQPVRTASSAPAELALAVSDANARIGIGAFVLDRERQAVCCAVHVFLDAEGALDLGALDAALAIELADGEQVLVGEEARTPDEVDRYAGRGVVVGGILYLEPLQEVEEARRDPLPVLRNPGPIRARG